MHVVAATLETRHVREANGATAAPDMGTNTCYSNVFNPRLTSTRYCGRTGDYCDVANKCQSNFGTCNGQSPVNPTTMKTTTTKQSPGSPSSSCAAVTITKDPATVTKSGPTVTKPGATVTSGGSTIIITTTITKDPITITKDGPTITKPGVTVTSDGTITTVTLPGEGVTVTVPVTQTQAASTITLPPSTVTLPAVTLPAETVTATLPAATVTLPAITETLPAVTLPAVTLPAETETLPAITETLPAVTETLSATTVTLPAETITETATQTAGASCPTGNPVVNAGFESPLPGSWVVLTSGDADVSRIAVSGGFALGSRINSGNPNLPQRILQAVNICPGTTYQIGFSARRVTTTGTVSAVLYVNDTPLAGGVITSTAFTSAFVVNGGMFSSTSKTVLVRIEFTYSGSSGSAKEVQVDNVTFTPV
jgi:hypothetical protein